MEVEAHEGLVEDAQRDKFVGKVEVMLKRVIAHPPRTQPAEPAVLLRQSGWLRGISDDIFQQLLRSADNVSFERGQLEATLP